MKDEVAELLKESKSPTIDMALNQGWEPDIVLALYSFVDILVKMGENQRNDIVLDLLKNASTRNQVKLFEPAFIDLAGEYLIGVEKKEHYWDEKPKSGLMVGLLELHNDIIKTAIDLGWECDLDKVKKLYQDHLTELKESELIEKIMDAYFGDQTVRGQVCFLEHEIEHEANEWLKTQPPPGS